MMHICVFGLNHKTANIELREKFAISKEVELVILQKLIQGGGVSEALYLGTCNRSEFYLITKDIKKCTAHLEEIIQSDIYNGFTFELFKNQTYSLYDNEAVMHLFKVAASLDSMVLGENEIFGQVKDAFEYASTTATSTGKHLNKLFQLAFTCTKQIKTQTDISKVPVSIGHIAVEMAKKVFSDLKKANLLLIGSGEMGTSALAYLKKFGVEKITLANRTLKNAQEIIDKYQISNATLRGLDDLPNQVAGHDIIITATSSKNYLITKEILQKHEEARSGKPLFIIDISLPRNVEPAANDIQWVFLYDIDDLQKVQNQGYAARKNEAGKALKIIDEYILKHQSWMQINKIEPAIISLRDHFEALRSFETGKMMAQLNHLADEDKQRINYFTQLIVNKMLNTPIQKIKERARTNPDASDLEKYLNNVFDLFDLDNK